MRRPGWPAEGQLPIVICCKGACLVYLGKESLRPFNILEIAQILILVFSQDWDLVSHFFLDCQVTTSHYQSSLLYLGISRHWAKTSIGRGVYRMNLTSSLPILCIMVYLFDGLELSHIMRLTQTSSRYCSCNTIKYVRRWYYERTEWYAIWCLPHSLIWLFCLLPK